MDGEPIYDQAGELTPRVKAMASFLMTFENSHLQTQRACAALESAGVLVPWTIRLRAVDEREEVLEGLLRIDQTERCPIFPTMHLSVCAARARSVSRMRSFYPSHDWTYWRAFRRLPCWAYGRTIPNPDLGFLRPSDDDVIF